MPVTHESLIVRIQEGGNAVDWEQFVAVYRPYVYNVVRRCGVSDNDASDVVQDVFVTLIRAMPQFEYSARRGRFRSWLKTVVQNIVVDWKRRRGRRHEVAFDERLTPAEWPDDEDLVAAHRVQVVQFVLGAVREASQPATWFCFEEHFWKGRPAGEVADEIGLTANAVYVNAARTVQRIRKQCLDFDEDLSAVGTTGDGGNSHRPAHRPAAKECRSVPSHRLPVDRGSLAWSSR